MKVLIVIITYNEIENIGLLIPEVFKIVPSNVDILVVDDSSPDGTGKAVEDLAVIFPNRLFLLTRPIKEGLAAAYMAGFKWGLSGDYDAFLQLDGDFSHNPVYIPKMLEEINNYDAVIGSRYVKDGGVVNWPLSRKIISRGGSLYSRLVLSCPINDFTGGFNMWKRTTLEKINLESVICKSYSFQIELKYRARAAGCSIKEIPIIFKDRTRGVSKITSGTLTEALVNVWKIKKNVGVDSGIDQFIKFAITGGLGTITNLLIYFFLVDIARLAPIPVSVFCFLIAGTQNYIINHKWSFRQNIPSEPLSFKRWFLFLCGALFGLLVNILIMSLIISSFNLPFKTIAQAFGILAGMIVNYFISKFFIFNKNKIKE